MNVLDEKNREDSSNNSLNKENSRDYASNDNNDRDTLDVINANFE
jgi:hypothetical protein